MTDLAARSLVIQRRINAPVAAIWAAWLNPASLPLWWGPEGYSCRTKRIDLRDGGDWVFDMIGPDGTVYPNHHRYTSLVENQRISYLLLMGENGPKHADALVTFTDQGGATEVTLRMVMNSVEDCDSAKAFGAVELGLQTLGKLARSIGAD
jgi:uncharacterized protein YndB with AHSA1/START domain